MVTDNNLVLTENDMKRYQRQIMIDGWGGNVQCKLKNTTVFVAGAGGLGSPVNYNLAVAGVGHIKLCDFDSPDLSNLNRQFLHNDSRIGMNKAISGKQTLNQLNPDIEVEAVTDKIEEHNAEELIGDAELIVDCMDNFPTRYILNKAAIRLGIPMVHGSVWGLEGRITFIHVPETPCFQCIFPEAPPKELFPVLGATPSVIGSLQALEALKYLGNLGNLTKNRMLIADLLSMSFYELKLRKDPNCPICQSENK
jgi:adenylyltransferase/sulfurtransferase